MKYLFIFLFITSVMPDAFATSTEKSTSWVDKSMSIRDISNLRLSKKVLIALLLLHAVMVGDGVQIEK